MLNYNVKIGLVPLRRDCTPRPGAFNWEIAEERGRVAEINAGLDRLNARLERSVRDAERRRAAAAVGRPQRLLVLAVGGQAALFRSAGGGRRGRDSGVSPSARP